LTLCPIPCQGARRFRAPASAENVDAFADEKQLPIIQYWMMIVPRLQIARPEQVIVAHLRGLLFGHLSIGLLQ
jgi:hypothetical protein